MYVKKMYSGLPMILTFKQDKLRRKLSCWVEEIGEHTAIISAPFAEGNPVLLEEGTKVTITFWDNICAYMIETKIIQRLTDPFPAYEIYLPEKCVRVQRRKYVRIQAAFPVFFQTVMASYAWSDWQRGYALDISGGGIRFVCEKSLEGNSSIKVRFTLTTEEINCLARICRIEQADVGSRYLVAVDFIGITEQQRDEIIRYVFSLQRDMLKRGLI